MKHSVILLVMFLLFAIVNIFGIIFIPNYKFTNTDTIILCTYFIVKAIESK